MLSPTRDIEQSRVKWQYRGQSRPPFAVKPESGEQSVWDFPRPPVIEEVAPVVSVRLEGVVIAESSRCRRVLETAGAPTYYLPPEDVIAPVDPGGTRSLCEWKGLAESLSVKGHDNIGWRYIEMFPEFQSLYRWCAFYPSKVDCYVGSERVSSQPGGYYGGWVTSDLVGPIKGEPGSSGW